MDHQPNHQLPDPGRILVAHIAIATPVNRLFEYLLPDRPPTSSLTGRLAGRRVTVPFGHQKKRIGLIVRVTDHSSHPVNKLKSIIDVLDTRPIVPEITLELLEWASGYYHHPIGDAIMQSLPPPVKKGTALMLPPVPTVWQATPEQQGKPGANAKRQQALLALLVRNKGGLSPDEVKHHGFTLANLKALEKKGLATQREVTHPGIQTGTQTVLREEQKEALTQITKKAGRFSIFLLQGVTGSGKTEVYIELAHEACRANQQILILLPEINLTPQTLARFQRHLPARTLCQHHSSLNDTEKIQAWASVLENRSAILIGTRSALFYPFDKLRYIIVDEEHDTSYKQQDGFRYSARDLATVLGKKHACPVILGSATPSLESLHNVRQKKFSHLFLKHRHGNASQPEVTLVSTRTGQINHGLTRELVTRIRQHLDRGNQVLVFINRRGYSPAYLCHDCGWIAGCHHCDSRLTLYKSRHQLRCNHCDTTYRLDRFCPNCKSLNLHPGGEGTEKVEETLQSLFDPVPVIRVDRDSTSRKRAMQSIHDRIHTGKPCILVGTQMLAKGHDFPNLTLVGILSSDDGLFSSDFRASEKVAQLVIQVAGRAGRADKKGEVIIQTAQPDHPLIQQVSQLDYDAAATSLLAERSAFRLPPCTSMAIIKSDSDDNELSLHYLQTIKTHLLSATRQSTPSDIVGPFPPAIQRKANRYRNLLVIQHTSRNQVQHYLHQLDSFLSTNKIAGKVKLLIDVDPLDMG
ncbi:MAG: primosomal protein N' [Gammaproteobacteria bacterium]|nr:MAG: primosomal protein N' [Pseudomonadota bacterium]PIE38720.1 MAG: primosomal protein N' [Gammaproteobacteria bacterium]